ncbi:MAG: GNAT family N-acetyltransferase [Bacillota bacterium]|nr:GNAT family N-acetyltransferase [Bacillota bacterium]
MPETGMINQIKELDPGTWQGYSLPCHYVSRHYYDVALVHTARGFIVTFTKKPFDTPFTRLPDGNDRLFQPWWEAARAWGLIENDRLVAVIETAAEEWSNRLRVTELWIAEAYRRRGLGTALMDIAMKRAREEKRRALMLETQSCNETAIAFYLACGFSLVGFDLCAYGNHDVAQREVRMELGILLEQNG